MGCATSRVGLSLAALGVLVETGGILGDVNRARCSYERFRLEFIPAAHARQISFFCELVAECGMGVAGRWRALVQRLAGTLPRSLPFSHLPTWRGELYLNLGGIPCLRLLLFISFDDT